MIDAADRLRRAGHGRDGTGAIVSWSVAEGRRGRRWREVVVEGGAIRSSLLLELDSDGRFSHVELSTGSGLLTLHPEPDGTLHGNAITGDGVRHIAGLEWDPVTALWLEGSSVCLAAGQQPDGSRAESWLHVGLDLALGFRVATRDWSLVDAAGLPVLEAGATWPLEG